MSSWQVFGLAGYLLTPASQSMTGPVLVLERSFLFTAAGQLRILTGFPFQPDFGNQAPRSETTLSRVCTHVKYNILGYLCKSGTDLGSRLSLEFFD
jgi:hypothetical protein